MTRGPHGRTGTPPLGIPASRSDGARPPGYGPPQSLPIPNSSARNGPLGPGNIPVAPASSSSLGGAPNRGTSTPQLPPGFREPMPPPSIANANGNMHPAHAQTLHSLGATVPLGPPQATKPANAIGRTTLNSPAYPPQGPFVTARPPGSPPANSAMMPPAIKFPEPGALLTSARGSYQVLRTLGSGNFGAVYECIGPFDQTYAVKMVRPANRPYAEVQAEWAKEVQRLQSLRHPNVVYIYDAFEDGGLFYLALERCDHPLSAMLGQPMQEGLVIELARQTLAAVQFLHDNDVVHDDIHAGNVLITHTDRPQVKIADFGISTELYGMAAVRPNVVHHAIMAPEILASGYTSRQSDLYQTGLVMFHMLVGSPALDTSAPYEELARQISDGAPRMRAETIGTGLGAVVAKMLRRREAYRFASAREVWSELRQLDAWKQRSLFPVK